MTYINKAESELKNEAKDNKTELKNEIEKLMKTIEENTKTPNLNTILIVFFGAVVAIINNFDKLIQMIALFKK